MRKGALLGVLMAILLAIPIALANPVAHLTETIAAFYNTSGSLLNFTGSGYAEVDAGSTTDVLQYIKINLSNSTGTNLISNQSYRATAATANAGDTTRMYVDTANATEDVSYNLTNGSLTPLAQLKLNYSNLAGGIDVIAARSNVFFFNITINSSHNMNNAVVNFQTAKNTYSTNDSMNLTNATATSGKADRADSDSDGFYDRINWTGNLSRGTAVNIHFNATIKEDTNFNSSDLYINLDLNYGLNSSYVSPTTLTGRKFETLFSRGPIRQGVDILYSATWRIRGFIKNIATDLSYNSTGWDLYEIGNLTSAKLSSSSASLLQSNDVRYSSWYDSGSAAKPYYTARFEWEVVWNNSVYEGSSKSRLKLPTLYEITLWVDKAVTQNMNNISGRNYTVVDQAKHLGHSNIDVNKLELLSIIPNKAEEGSSAQWDINYILAEYVNSTGSYDITSSAGITAANATLTSNGSVVLNITNMTDVLGHYLRQNEFIRLTYNINSSVSSTNETFQFEGNTTMTTASGTPIASNMSSSKLIQGVITDSDYPIVKLISPANASTEISTNTIVFYYNASDATSAIANCSLVLNGSVNQTTQSPAENTRLNYTVYLPNSTYLWNVNCTDDSSVRNTNKSETWALTVNFIKPMNDTDFPSITLVSPENGSSYTSSSTVTFSYTANDTSSNLANCSLIINGTRNQTTQTPAENTQLSFSQELRNNDYLWNVNCTDDSNNTNTNLSRLWKLTVNFVAPFCGDGSCDSGEGCGSCQADCGSCPAAPPSAGGGGAGGRALEPPRKLGIDIEKIRGDVFIIAGNLVEVEVVNKVVDPWSLGAQDVEVMIYVPRDSELDIGSISIKLYNAETDSWTRLEQDKDFDVIDKGYVNIGSNRYKADLIKKAEGSWILYNDDRIGIRYEAKLPKGTHYILTRTSAFDPYNEKTVIEDVYTPITITEIIEEFPFVIKETNFTQGEAIVGKPVWWIKTVELYNPGEKALTQTISTDVFNDVLNVYLIEGGNKRELELTKKGNVKAVWEESLAPKERKTYIIKAITPPVIETELATDILRTDNSSAIFILDAAIENTALEDYTELHYALPVAPEKIIEITEGGNKIEHDASSAIIPLMQAEEKKKLTITYKEKIPLMVVWLKKEEYSCQEEAVLDITTIIIADEEINGLNLENEAYESIDFETVYADSTPIARLEPKKELKLTKKVNLGRLSPGKYELISYLKKNFANILSSRKEFNVVCPGGVMLAPPREVSWIWILIIFLLIATIRSTEKYWQPQLKHGYEMIYGKVKRIKPGEASVQKAIKEHEERLHKEMPYLGGFLERVENLRLQREEALRERIEAVKEAKELRIKERERALREREKFEIKEKKEREELLKQRELERIKALEEKERAREKRIKQRETEKEKLKLERQKALEEREAKRREWLAEHRNRELEAIKLKERVELGRFKMHKELKERERAEKEIRLKEMEKLLEQKKQERGKTAEEREAKRMEAEELRLKERETILKEQRRIERKKDKEKEELSRQKELEKLRADEEKERARNERIRQREEELKIKTSKEKKIEEEKRELEAERLKHEELEKERQKLDEEKKRIAEKAKLERELGLLEEGHDAGFISEESYNKDKEKIEERLRGI